jgi:hypothetical protein
MQGDRPRLGDNRSALVVTAAAGRIAPARVHLERPAHDAEGRLTILPGTGGVHPGVHAGDPVDRWLADHLMVGASIEDDVTAPAEPGSLHLLGCIGNRVRDAAGRPIGVVAGKRGGLAPGFMPPNLMSVEVADAWAERLKPGDRVVVEAQGRGLALSDWPDVALLNLSPRLLDHLPLRLDGDRLAVGVRAIVPSRYAGAGLGQDAWVGDLEIAVDPASDASLAGLRFGDLVAFAAIDGRISRFYRPGFVAVGAVAHGPSPVPGHGIGVTILLSGPAEQLEPAVEEGGSVGPLLRQWAAELGQ